ncbi:hypothetical protein ACG97_05995 [Vogesella sp. EB]|uniref:Uncharacterized protein n=1 Tax=Vogesella indigofera TaxID=45465 RepID=A0A495BKV2_VOGIN|nr:MULTISPECIES: hypothetical protein [Vogesella]KMJ53794.1 hypothetical protein ACG97_05995 [Vogesella sp. EB]RKQ61242.1 hypothetical protein C8E02_1009 [Vogesella indigofera]
MQRIEFDVTTGEKRVVQLTAEEIAEIQKTAAAIPANIPSEVTRYQALAALHLAGLLGNVEAMMADAATDKLTVIAWQNAQAFKRNSPMVLDMAQQLNLTDQQLDDLFISASQIE